MNLQNLNYTELTEKEMRETNGGVLFWLLVLPFIIKYFIDSNQK